MSELLWNLAFNADGLLVGFAAGAILGGVLVAAAAYEAGRRRTIRELAAIGGLRKLAEEFADEIDAPIVPEWPRGAA